MHRYFAMRRPSAASIKIFVLLLLENKILIAIVNFCNVKQG